MKGKPLQYTQMELLKKKKLLYYLIKTKIKCKCFCNQCVKWLKKFLCSSIKKHMEDDNVPSMVIQVHTKFHTSTHSLVSGLQNV